MSPGAILAAILLAAVGAARAGEAAWPPSPESAARLAELRAVLIDPASTAAARDAARAEMLRMILAHPDSPPPKQMPPRAAVIVPSGPGAKSPVPNTVAGPAPPPVSRVAPPVTPPPAITSPATGATLFPQGTGYLDPATGRFYQAVPGGYIDPATGRFVPKP